MLTDWHMLISPWRVCTPSRNKDKQKELGANAVECDCCCKWGQCNVNMRANVSYITEVVDKMFGL